MDAASRNEIAGFEFGQGRFSAAPIPHHAGLPISGLPGQLGQLVPHDPPLSVVVRQRRDRALSRRDQKFVHLIGPAVLDLELHRARLDFVGAEDNAVLVALVRQIAFAQQILSGNFKTTSALRMHCSPSILNWLHRPFLDER